MFKGKKGFTLIEMLVVIGVIGILAAGLLAAIDPMEQLKKGRDTRKRSLAVEVVNATTRYYATRGTMPWASGGDPSESVLSGLSAIITNLVTMGELKSDFAATVALGGIGDAIFVTGSYTAATVVACFDPESKSISLDPTTVFTKAGVINTASCPALIGCYWCAK